MDIVMDTLGYKELAEFYSRHFSLGWISSNFEEKLALITFICYITEQMKQKKPDVTHYQVIRKLAYPSLSENIIKGLAVVCADFSYGCTKFPDFGVKPKDMPTQIKNILNKILPF